MTFCLGNGGFGFPNAGSARGWEHMILNCAWFCTCMLCFQSSKLLTCDPQATTQTPFEGKSVPSMRWKRNATMTQGKCQNLLGCSIFRHFIQGSRSLLMEHAPVYLGAPTDSTSFLRHMTLQMRLFGLNLLPFYNLIIHVISILTQRIHGVLFPK